MVAASFSKYSKLTVLIILLRRFPEREVNLTILQMNFTSLDPFLKLKYFSGVPVVVQWVTNRINIHEDVGLIPGLTQWVKDQAAV